MAVVSSVARQSSLVLQQGQRAKASYGPASPPPFTSAHPTSPHKRPPPSDDTMMPEGIDPAAASAAGKAAAAAAGTSAKKRKSSTRPKAPPPVRGQMGECSRCGLVKDLHDDFYRDPSKSRGASSHCKACASEKDRLRIQAGPSVMVLTAKCSRCGIERAREDMIVDKRRKTGLDARCKFCRREEHRKKKALLAAAKNQGPEGSAQLKELQCMRCDVVKPTEMFADNAKSATGKASTCLDCQARARQLKRTSQADVTAGDSASPAAAQHASLAAASTSAAAPAPGAAATATQAPERKRARPVPRSQPLTVLPPAAATAGAGTATAEAVAAAVAEKLGAGGGGGAAVVAHVGVVPPSVSSRPAPAAVACQAVAAALTSHLGLHAPVAHAPSPQPVALSEMMCGRPLRAPSRTTRSSCSRAQQGPPPPQLCPQALLTAAAAGVATQAAAGGGGRATRRGSGGRAAPKCAPSPFLPMSTPTTEWCDGAELLSLPEALAACLLDQPEHQQQRPAQHQGWAVITQGPGSVTTMGDCTAPGAPPPSCTADQVMMELQPQQCAQELPSLAMHAPEGGMLLSALTLRELQQEQQQQAGPAGPTTTISMEAEHAFSLGLGTSGSLNWDLLMQEAGEEGVDPSMQAAIIASLHDSPAVTPPLGTPRTGPPPDPPPPPALAPATAGPSTSSAPAPRVSAFAHPSVQQQAPASHTTSPTLAAKVNRMLPLSRVHSGAQGRLTGAAPGPSSAAAAALNMMRQPSGPKHLYRLWREDDESLLVPMPSLMTSRAYASTCEPDASIEDTHDCLTNELLDSRDTCLTGETAQPSFSETLDVLNETCQDVTSAAQAAAALGQDEEDPGVTAATSFSLDPAHLAQLLAGIQVPGTEWNDAALNNAGGEEGEDWVLVDPKRGQ